jgi:hypothetical protein
MAYQLIHDFQESKNRLTEELINSFLHNSISLENYEILIKSLQNVETENDLLNIKKMIGENILLNTEEQYSHEIADKKRNSYTILSYKNTPGSLINKISGKFITILGENTITINENDLIEDDTLINVISILGTTIIYVPDDIILEKHGDYLVGDIWIDKKVRNNRGIGRKKIIIFGEVILGEIIIKVKKEKMTAKRRMEELKENMKKEKGMMIDEIKRLIDKITN